MPNGRATAHARAAAHGLVEHDVGPIDAARLEAFLWQIAGRPPAAPAEWQRARPLVIALDNYSVHHSHTIASARPQLAAAQIELVYLVRYCPEQSGIEPVWNDVKQHHIPVRSYEHVADLKRAVDAALTGKLEALQRVLNLQLAGDVPDEPGPVRRGHHENGTQDRQPAATYPACRPLLSLRQRPGYGCIPPGS